MLRWSDLAAAVQAAPGAVLRSDFWRQVLARAVLSRQFLAYAAGTALLLLVNNLLAAWAFLLLGLVLLLPYAFWCFHPATVRVLRDSLQLPPPHVDEDPPFSQYLSWTAPLIGLALLLIAGSFVPALAQGTPLRLYTLFALLLVQQAALALFTRTALASHFDLGDVEAFVVGTRWQRRLVWFPLTLLLLWLLGMAAHGAMGLVGWPGALALELAGLALLGVAFTGALLLACARMATPAQTATVVLSDLARGDAQTRPMTDAEMQAMREQLKPRRRVARKKPGFARLTPANVIGIALVMSAGGVYLARQPLTDWAFSRDAVYAAAARGSVPERLRAGFVAYGCSGDLDRARWIWRLGATDSADHGQLLACAACKRNQPAVAWVLQAEPGLSVQMRIPGEGGRPRTALSCAARDNDLALARELLLRGAQPRHLQPRDSALQAAAGAQNWQMLRLLLQNDPGAAPAATFAALDALQAPNARSPAELLPRLLQAGLVLNATDRQGRNLFHWAAFRHDLRLARALLDRGLAAKPETSLARADRQGALPWMYVLRRAERDGRPLDTEAAELLRLLLPPDFDVNAVLRAAPDRDASDPFPAGWTPASAVQNDPLAREVLGLGGLLTGGS